MRQGDDVVPLVLTLNAAARGVPATAGLVVRLGNLWRAGDLLNVEAGTLQSSPIKIDWLNAIWHVEPVGRTEFVRIRNEWKPDVFIHAEHGLEAGQISTDWYSAMWQMEPVSGTRYFRLRNRWQSDQTCTWKRVA